jgi:hypothetical protein
MRRVLRRTARPCRAPAIAQIVASMRADSGSIPNVTSLARRFGCAHESGLRACEAGLQLLKGLLLRQPAATCALAFPTVKTAMGSVLRKSFKKDIAKSAGHLAYSFAKIEARKLLEVRTWSETELEILESFAARFARTSDLIISRYLRLWATDIDPAFDGTLIDLLNLAEKHDIITSTAIWWRIRKLRNFTTHEYTDERLLETYREMVLLTPQVLAAKEKICA